MRDFLYRRSMLTHLMTAMVCVFSCLLVVADDPPGVAPAVGTGSWTCDATVSCGTLTHTETGRGNTEEEAEAEARRLITEWADANCNGEPHAIATGEPVEEIPDVKPPTTGTESAKANSPESQIAAPHVVWKVYFQCRAANGNSESTTRSGKNFCEAYNKARIVVCKYIAESGGACCCCYRVVQRPECRNSCP